MASKAQPRAAGPCDHANRLIRRDMRGATKEQLWCGTWYDCPSPGCSFTRLEPSAALLQQLREQQSRAAQPRLPLPDA